jgi:hypothetical protein
MRIQFLPESAAMAIEPAPERAMVSITNPGEAAQLRDGWGALLRVQFADAAYDEATIHGYGRMWKLSSRGFFDKPKAILVDLAALRSLRRRRESLGCGGQVCRGLLRCPPRSKS